MLLIKIEDIRRATLPSHSGNEGWIGVSPAGDAYHVVVPVDIQIARGVMACNRPTDGTPFGGYTSWLYFRCAPYEDEGTMDRSDRDRQVQKNTADLINLLISYGIQARFTCEAVAESSEVDRPGVVARRVISCQGCSKSWQKIQEFLRDPEVKLDRYRAFPEDFILGHLLFVHLCGSVIEIPTTKFIKPGSGQKSLIGSHACPGLCYYETSFRPCSARCEGSRYRRIACNIKLRDVNRSTGKPL